MNLKTRQDQTIISEAFEDGGTVLRRMTSDWLGVVVVMSCRCGECTPKNAEVCIIIMSSDEVMCYCAGQITQVFGLGPSMKRWKTYPETLGAPVLRPHCC